jgi:hypothetical protein
MNTSQVNGSALNGSPVEGNNITLSGGFGTACFLSAALIANAILSGGIFNTPATGGNVSTLLSGGIESTTTVDGNYFMTANLGGGIFSENFIDSVRLASSPGLTGGIESSSSFGGQMRTHVRLQSDDQVGQLSIVDGNLHRFSGMRGGIEGTSIIGGLITGGTFLGSGGVHSTSSMGGLLQHTDRLVLGEGGVYSDSAMGGSLKNGVILTGGFLLTHQLGKELDIEAILTDGIYNVGQMSTHPMQISCMMNSGMGSYSELQSKVKLSPFCNGGVSATAQLGGTQRISAKLQGGVTSTHTLTSNGIKASQILRGGIVSNVTHDAKLRTHVRLQGGLVSAGNSVGGDIVEGFRDPLLNNWALSIVSATVLLEIFTPESDT